MDYNSTVNQAIKGRLVDREVICNVNQVVDDLIQLNYHDHKLGIALEDLDSSYYEFEGDQLSKSELDDKKEALRVNLDRVSDLILDFTDYEGVTSEWLDRWEERLLKIQAYYVSLIEEADDLEPSYYEVFEWWAVTGWFMGKLEELGEITLETHGLCLWGRCTTGQAILLDWVISQVAEELQILQGQPNSWED